jgi:hypothetical protein
VAAARRRVVGIFARSSRAWLYGEWAAGRGPQRIWPGSHPRIHREDLESWARSLKAGPNALQGPASSKAPSAHTVIEHVSIGISPRHRSAGGVRREHLSPAMKRQVKAQIEEGERQRIARLKRRIGQGAPHEASSRFNSH